MNFNTLTALNFMSFKSLYFNIPDNGLHFIGGQVEEKPMSNSNGAGKSSITEALCFGLFGKTIRNAGKDDIVNRDVGKDCVVGIEFENNNQKYTVFRFRNDTENANELRLLQGEKDITLGTINATQDMINNVLGMNWMVFSNAVIFGENARRFTQAKDSEKKRIFDEIMLFQQYVEAQIKAKDELKSINITLSKAGNDFIVIESSMQQYRTTLNEENERLDIAKKTKIKALDYIKILNSEIAVLDAEIKTDNEELKRIEIDKNSLEEENDLLYKTVVDLTAKKTEGLREYKNKENEYLVHVKMAMIKCTELNEILEISDLPEGVRCPQCRQIVTKGSIEEVKKHFRKKLIESDSEYELELKLHNKAKTLREEAEHDFDKKIDDARELRGDFDTQITKFINKIRFLKDVISDLKASIKSKSDEIGLREGYTEKAIAEIKDRKEKISIKIKDLDQKRLDLNVTIEDLKNEILYYDFWVEGFGNRGIKSFLLDEIVPELNKKATYYASMLMDNEIQIEFNTESTLKSGEIRDKFNISIMYSDEVVAYENCSSGEKGRIDVAILLALQSLIFSRAVGNCNLVVFDEVFTNLDITGIERVVNLLREEAENKAILVISHQNELKDYFDNQILIIKDEDGSRIEQ